MQTLLEILRKTEAFFERVGLESPKIEAEWLLAGTLGCRRLDLFLQYDKPMEESFLEEFREKVRRRSAHEPLQYVLGCADFHNLRLSVEPGVLIPRPETEQLVDKILARIGAGGELRIVDLGTGSGAIALALAKALPQARVLAVDASPAALKLARCNAEALGLRERVAFRSGNWLEGLDLEADCIVSNPPYLTESEWTVTAPEVRCFEPKEALVADDQGMADLKNIIREAFSRLAPGGLLALETGIDHGPAIGQFAQTAGYTGISLERDVSDRQRFLFGIKA